jgi:hypothetical protein
MKSTSNTNFFGHRMDKECPAGELGMPDANKDGKKCGNCGGLIEADRHAVCEKCERAIAESIDHLEEEDMLRPLEGEGSSPNVQP